MTESVRKTLQKISLTFQMMFKMIGIMFRLSPLSFILLTVCEISLSFIPVVQIFVTFKLMNAVQLIASRGLPELIIGYRILLFQFGLLLMGIILELLNTHVSKNLRLHATLHFGNEISTKSSRLTLLNFEKHDFYDLLQRVSTGFEMRGLLFFQSFLQIIQSTFTLIGFFVVLMRFHWALAVGLLLLVVPSLFINIRETHFQFSQFVRQTPASRRANYFFSLLTNREWAKEVRIFSLSHYIVNQWKVYYKQNGIEQLALDRKMSILKLGINGFTLLIVTLVSGLLLNLAAIGKLSLSYFIALVQIITTVQGNLKVLASYLANIYEQALYTRDLFIFLESEEESEELEESDKLPFPANILSEITVRNAMFIYPNTGRTVLNNISFEVKAGEKIAIVGENGSGKSTLVKCLLGLYPLTEGIIEYNGVSLSNIDLKDMRKHVTAIFQDFVQYQLTLRENIGFGKIDYMDDNARLQSAAAISGVDQFINQLPQGYDTTLGYSFMGGQELSFGQWQKIAISRAFFSDSEVIVLDEPTASLDPMTEAVLFETIAQLTQGKTTFFISHRLGVCRAADRILVLKNGELIEQGNHDQLMQSNGEYARMFSIQAEWYQ
ncbi:MAG: putative transporter ATP-binding protein [Bacilli bacterium]|nr:putative transporter ATP-binding protein [Bacilli bacterium]